MTPPLITDGIRAAMHRDEYDRIERANFSTLKWIDLSPAHYRARLVTPDDDTDAKKLGRVLHIAVFEPDRFRAMTAVWDGGVRRGKDWEAFCRKNEGRELLTENEADICARLHDAVRADPAARLFVQDGHGEAALFWTMRGIPCKGRVDFVRPGALADLKSTKCAKGEPFSRQVVALNWHVQSAWYRDAYTLLTGERLPYKLIAVEKGPPHCAVQVWNVPEDLLRIGTETYLRWLDTLAECRERAHWPGYSDPPGELELPIPPWMVPDDDPTGLGLEFGAEE